MGRASARPTFEGVRLHGEGCSCGGEESSRWGFGGRWGSRVLAWWRGRETQQPQRRRGERRGRWCPRGRSWRRRGRSARCSHRREPRPVRARDRWSCRSGSTRWPPSCCRSSRRSWRGCWSTCPARTSARAARPPCSAGPAPRPVRPARCVPPGPGAGSCSGVGKVQHDARHVELARYRGCCRDYIRVTRQHDGARHDRVPARVRARTTGAC